jgi:hypothetical protein
LVLQPLILLQVELCPSSFVAFTLSNGLVVFQARAVLKWLHPGCRGNVFECYFQPISGCVVTAEEIQRAKQLNHTSTNGDFFDTYPLRNERVLLLHGLPLSDPCGLCMDQVRRCPSSIRADQEFIRNAAATVADERSLLRRALRDGCEVRGGYC